MDNTKDNNDALGTMMSRDERREFLKMRGELLTLLEGRLDRDEIETFRMFVRSMMRLDTPSHTANGLCKAVLSIKVAHAFASMIEPDRNILLAIGMYQMLEDGLIDILAIRRK